jgi:hypothetical protein
VLPWWGWVLVWVVLIVGGAALVVWRGWRVWGRVKALGRDVAEAQRTAAALQSQVERIEENSAAPSGDLAVFRDPEAVRKERVEVRGALKKERLARAEARRPGWARSVD